MDQAWPWRSSTAPNLGYEGEPGPNLHIEFQYGPMDRMPMRGHPRSEHQYSWDPVTASAVSSQGFNPPPMAASSWNHSHVPGYPFYMFPEVPTRSVFQDLVLQSPVIHEDTGVGRPISQGHPINGHAWPQSNLQVQRAAHLPDDFGQGNVNSFGDHVGDFSTPPYDYGVEQLPLPTPSPGSTARGSETPGSLYEDKMGFYLNQDEPWRPLSTDREDYKATQDERDRSYYYSHGQSISLDDW